MRKLSLINRYSYFLMSDINTLSHTTWIYNFHIIFAPKYIYGKIQEALGKILRKLCDRKGLTIIEESTRPDHIHMLVSIPQKYSVLDFL